MNKTMKMNTDSGNSSGADVTKKVDVNGTAKSACAFPTSSSNLETQERTVKMHTISSTRLSGIKTRSLTMDRFKKVLRNVLFFPLFHHCSNVDEAVADSLVGASHE